MIEGAILVLCMLMEGIPLVCISHSSEYSGVVITFEWTA